MQRTTFRHLDREWEAVVPASPGERAPVRFRHADDDDPATYEARIHREELERPQPEREAALRRGLESALVLEALRGRDAGLTAEEVGRETGIPVEAAGDRLDVMDAVQPVAGTAGPVRYRPVATGEP